VKTPPTQFAVPENEASSHGIPRAFLLAPDFSSTRSQHSKLRDNRRVQIKTSEGYRETALLKPTTAQEFRVLRRLLKVAVRKNSRLKILLAIRSNVGKCFRMSKAVHVGA
jgi:hypothetical protein